MGNEICLRALSLVDWPCDQWLVPPQAYEVGHTEIIELFKKIKTRRGNYCGGTGVNLGGFRQVNTDEYDYNTLNIILKKF